MIRVVLFFCLSVLVLNAAIFRQNSQDVVIDSKRNLMWQDNIDAVKLRLPHDEAQEFCEGLIFAGHTNWRLPDIEEYKTIVDKTNTQSYINYAFKYNLPKGYWAEKAHWRTLWFYADYMNFISGTAYFDSRHKKKYFRCIRDIR